MKPIMKVTVQEATARLSELLRQVREGREVIIVADDRPMAKLIPVRVNQEPRLFGGYEGRVRISQDFDAELSEEFWLDKQAE